MELDQDYIYRVKDTDTSRRVRLLEILDQKRPIRYRVEFVDFDEESGDRVLSVPGVRLRGPWSLVAEYDELMANWDRLRDLELTEVEDSACYMVFDELITGDVASIETKPVKWITLIRVRKALEDITGASSLEAMTHELPSFEIEGKLYLSPEGTLAVAETVASRHPAPFLKWVDRDERECKTRSKYGREFRDSSVNERRGTSPGWEFEQYQQRDRPLHELLRAWCGDRAITLDERLAAAEVRLREAVVLLVTIGGKRAGWRSVLEHGADATEEGAMAAAAEFVAKHSSLQRRRLPDVDQLRSASRPRAAPEVRAGLEADRIETGPRRHIPVSSSGRAE